MNESAERKEGIGWMIFDALFFWVAAGFLFLILALWLVMFYSIAQGVKEGFDSHSDPAMLGFAYLPLSLAYLCVLPVYFVFGKPGRAIHRENPYPTWPDRWTRKMLIAYPLLVLLLFVVSMFVSEALY